MLRVCTGFEVSFEMILLIKIRIILLHSTPQDLIQIQRKGEGMDRGTERLSGRLVDRWRSEGSDGGGSLEISGSAVVP